MPLPDQRTEVFARIREALRQPAPHHHPASAVDDGLPAADAFRSWLPLVGPTFEDQAALFAQNALQLKAEFSPVTSLDEAAAHLKVIAQEAGWKRIATHQHPLAAPLAEKLGLSILLTDPGYAITDLEQCDAAITGCDALIAQAGSVLVTNRSAGGRALSVLPPHHIVIAERRQMVPDLGSALQVARDLYAPNWPSFMSFITGPSRTGDIERILVLGAHGPKRLTIFLV